MSTTASTPARSRQSSRLSWTFYLWIALGLAAASTLVILIWGAGGGTADPSRASNALHMSRTTAVINSGVLVFREGLETILVLAAITASFRGSNSAFRRPVVGGAALGGLATVGTWFAAVGLLGIFGASGFTLQAATGIPAIIVLLVVMNWFFHKVYWTGWISHHHKRRKTLLADQENNRRRILIGFVLLGFTSIYREGFEIVLFLQNLRLTFGSSVVLEGVTLGLLFTAAIGVLTFKLHAKLPYKKMLILTGALLLMVLVVMVGEEVNEMQLAGWIGTSNVGVSLPGWVGQWFSLFPNWESLGAQVAAVVFVLGSYAGAQYLRVWRPRRRGLAAARRAEEPPAAVAVTVSSSAPAPLGSRPLSA